MAETVFTDLMQPGLKTLTMVLLYTVAQLALKQAGIVWRLTLPSSAPRYLEPTQQCALSSMLNPNLFVLVVVPLVVRCYIPT